MGLFVQHMFKEIFAPSIPIRDSLPKRKKMNYDEQAMEQWVREFTARYPRTLRRGALALWWSNKNRATLEESTNRAAAEGRPLRVISN